VEVELQDLVRRGSWALITGRRGEVRRPGKVEYLNLGAYRDIRVERLRSFKEY